MKKLPDNILLGTKYNRLTIQEYMGTKNHKRMYKCLCDCGNTVVLALSAVRNGYTKSCGCARGQHKQSATRLYHIWTGMKQRCNNKNCSIYYKYGGNGIGICKEWKNEFMEFYKWAVSHNYNDSLTIDRIDSNGDYCPENCRWATPYEQNCHLAALKTNKSGYTGVSWSKKENKWQCVISIANKSRRIGAYKTQKEAVEARNTFIDTNGLKHKKNIYSGELHQ